MTIILSCLALLATFYQLYLQRRHNEKSLRPLGQIDLPDHNKQIAVHIRNNGLGPLIIDRLTFIKGDNIYSNIKDCLDLDPRSYMHMAINDSVKRVVLPNSYLVVFEKNFRNQAEESDMDHVRRLLTPITLKVDCRDIYDNRIVIQRDFKWFSRYVMENPTE